VLPQTDEEIDMSRYADLRPDEIADWHAAMLKALPKDLSPALVRAWTSDLSALTTALRSALVTDHMPTGTPWSVWRTVAIGLRDSPEDLLTLLDESKCYLTEKTRDLVTKIKMVQPSTRMLKLVRVNIVELGLSGRTPYPVICEKALTFGLKLCPQEAGPSLWLQYKDQPEQESIKIASEPIKSTFDEQPDDEESRRHMSVFELYNDGNGRWLTNSVGGDVECYGNETTFIFAVP